MSISLRCGQCEAAYKVAVEHAGKTLKCKKCGTQLKIPSPAGQVAKVDSVPFVKPIAAPSARPAKVVSNIAAATSQPEQLERSIVDRERALVKQVPLVQNPSLDVAKIVGAIHGKIDPIRMTWQYRGALLAASLLMILLPLIYIGLIVLFAMLVYWHATMNTGILQQRVSGRGYIFIVLLYATPIVVGVVAVVFMIKPLFARRPNDERRRSLTRSGQPKLFAFVDHLCDSVHSPIPKRIDVDCNVNASASFRRGMLSMVGNDLVLTVGMPLVAGLNVREFAGVLAHEFGHFSQGFGMRTSYLIRTINHWFVRVVYERDQWDEKLEQWASQVDLRIGIVLHAARFMVWLTRRILWCLMMLGNVVCCYLMRQMEFDADLHETRFSGADAFESTAGKLPFLSVAYEQAMSDQHQFYLDGRLCDDLPSLTRLNRDTQDPELITKIAESIAADKTGWLATHPCDKDRIAAARRDDSPGIFTLNAPASVLFENYPEVCRGVTQDYLSQVLGKQYKPQMLQPFELLASQKTKSKEASNALKSMFGHNLAVPRPIIFSTTRLAKCVDAKEVFEQLKTSRQEMIRLRNDYADTSKQLDQYDTDWMSCHQTAVWLDLGAKLDQKDYRVPVASTAAANEAARGFRKKMTELSSKLIPFEDEFANRVQAAIKLLGSRRLQSKLDDGAVQLAVAQKACQTLASFHDLLMDIAETRNHFSAFGTLLQAVSGQEVGTEVIAKLMEQSKMINANLGKLKDAMSTLLFPFEHADGQITVAHYLVPTLSQSEDFADVAQAGHKMLEQFHFLYFRCVGTLAHFCLQVETALGLPSSEVQLDE